MRLARVPAEIGAAGPSSSRIGATRRELMASAAGIPRARASRFVGRDIDGGSWSPAGRAELPRGAVDIGGRGADSPVELPSPEPDLRRSRSRGESGSCEMAGIDGATGREEVEKTRSR